MIQDHFAQKSMILIKNKKEQSENKEYIIGTVFQLSAASFLLSGNLLYQVYLWFVFQGGVMESVPLRTWRKQFTSGRQMTTCAVWHTPHYNLVKYWNTCKRFIKQERAGIQVSGSMRFGIKYVFNLNSSVSLLAEHRGLSNCLFRNANQTFTVKLLLENVGTAYVDSKCSS